jgi:hypothetical protein
MPRHLIQGPDGTKHIIEAPDGATPDDIMAFAEQQFAGAKPSTAPPTPPDTRSDAEKRADERVKTDRQANRGFMQNVDDTVRNLARGTPVGSFMDEIAARGNALFGGEPYESGVEYQRATDRAIDAESSKVGALPIIGDVTTGGLTKLTGAIASAPVAPIARFFGNGSLLARTGNAALSGAGYGAAYGAGEGDTGQERAGNALMGAGVGLAGGAVIPAVASGARNVTNALANWARPLPQSVGVFSPGAVNRLSRAVGADDLTAANYVRQTNALGPEGMLADMGPNLTDQASAIATQPGRGSRIVRDALVDRRRGSAARTEADVDATLGPARNLVQLEENVVGQARAQAAPHYEQFYQTIVPQTPELQAVMQRVPQRVINAAEELAAVDRNYAQYAAQTGEPNGIVYDLVKRAADDLATAARNKGEMNNARLFGELARDLRNAVDGALSPGQPQASPWAVARAIAGDGMQFREGLEEGGRAFSRGTHPDQMAADLGGMPHVQRMGYQEGARGQIRDIMGNAATTQGENAAAAARKTLGSEYARDKVGMITNNAARLIRRLDAEATFQRTSNDVLSNSRTAGRLAAQKEFPNAADTSAATEVGRKSVSGVAMEAAYRLANALVGGALNARRAAIAEDAARMLVSQGTSRDAIARGLREYARDRRLTANAAQALEAAAQTILQGVRQRSVDASLPGR